MTVATLGFVGLGNMGHPMSSRLVAAGHALVGYDVAGTAERLPAGATAAASAAEVAARADVVFLSLPNGDASRAVCAAIADEPERRATTVVDLSTIGTRAARECAALLEAADVAYVDAPVSGGVPGARNGTLSIMVGAPAELYERVLPLLQVIGKNCFRLGDAPGHGQAMKLLNNYLSATALAATSEAVLYGARQGLDLAQMIDVLSVSTGRNTAVTDKFPRAVLPRTFDYGFAGALMTKDVSLFLAEAEAAGTPRPLAAGLQALWQRFQAARPDADFTAIYEFIEGGEA